MASIVADNRGTGVGVTADMTEIQHAEEGDAPAYLEGWALISLTLAFMSISFVLALDNTILGLGLLSVETSSGMANVHTESDRDTPDLERLPEP
jgi:hypothetical protein